MPPWLRDAHETYLICQAVPGYQLDDEEGSDFRLQVMARIHAVYEDIHLQQQAALMGVT